MPLLWFFGLWGLYRLGFYNSVGTINGNLIVVVAAAWCCHFIDIIDTTGNRSTVWCSGKGVGSFSMRSSIGSSAQELHSEKVKGHSNQSVLCTCYVTWTCVVLDKGTMYENLMQLIHNLVQLDLPFENNVSVWIM